MNAGLHRIWGIWDFIYQHITRLEYVDKENGNIFRVVFCKYHGPDLITSDQKIIKNGDPIVKLHIYNWQLAKMMDGNDTRIALRLLKTIRDSLPELAVYIHNHKKGASVKGLMGTTLLHRGVHKLGFDVHDVPDWAWFKIKNRYLKLLLVMMHPDGKSRLHIRNEELVVKRVYISKEKFTQRYYHPNLHQEEPQKAEKAFSTPIAMERNR